MYCDDSGDDSGDEVPKKKQAKLSIWEPKKLRSVTDIQKALGMDTNLGRGMPSISDHMKKSVDEFDAESKSRLVHFVVSAMSNICALVCPKDPTALVQRCAENIKMFNAGCRDKSSRMGAERMLERIKWQNPDRLDLLSETEIRQAISALIAKMKSGKEITLSNSRGIAMPYLATVVRIFVEGETQDA